MPYKQLPHSCMEKTPNNQDIHLGNGFHAYIVKGFSKEWYHSAEYHKRYYVNHKEEYGITAKKYKAKKIMQYNDDRIKLTKEEEKMLKNIDENEQRRMEQNRVMQETFIASLSNPLYSQRSRYKQYQRDLENFQEIDWEAENYLKRYLKGCKRLGSRELSKKMFKERWG